MLDDVHGSYGTGDDRHDRGQKLDVVRVHRRIPYWHEHLRTRSRLRRAGEKQPLAPRADLAVGILHVDPTLVRQIAETARSLEIVIEAFARFPEDAPGRGDRS